MTIIATDAARALALAFAVLALGCGARSELETCTTEACRRAESRASCAALHAFDPKLPSGTYELTTDGVTYGDYCDMGTDGGGWTLVLKADGLLPTFAFDAPAWTVGKAFGDSPDVSLVEAQFESYRRVPLHELRVELVEPGGDARAVEAALEGSSLGDVVAGGFTPLDVTKESWLTLVPGAILQANCNLSGVDASGAEATHSRVRIGFVANQENDCNTPDSFIGVGGQDQRTTISSGAFCASSWCTVGPARAISRFGLVFVR